MESKTVFSLVLNHIALYVADLTKSTAFYSDVMQLTAIPEPFKDGLHSWFQLTGNCQLHLIGGARQKEHPHINTHLAFTVGHFEAFTQHLVQKGYNYCNAQREWGKIHTRPDGILQIFFVDPDGYWLEVNNDQ